MQIVILVAFIVVLTLAGRETDTLESLMAPSWWVVPVLLAYLGVAAALSRINTVLALRSMSGSAEVPPVTPRRHNLLSMLAQLWLIAGLAGLVAIGYGRWVMEDLNWQLTIGEWSVLVGTATLPLAGNLMVVAPFIAALLLTWALDYPFHRASRQRLFQREAWASQAARRCWTPGEYVSYNVRHQLLFIAVPVGLILLGRDVLWMYLLPWLPRSFGEHVVLALSACLALGVFLAAPLMIVRILRTEPLPNGCLRRDLEDLLGRLNLRCRDILVWKSGGMITNAGVMGLAPPVRYVLLSDALLEHMDQRHVRAIFAHEAGHIVNHHIFYAALFAIGAATLCGAASEFVFQVVPLPQWAGEMTVLVLLAAGWGVGFGWLSRRFERQSDVMAAWVSGDTGAVLSGDTRITPEGAATFAEALQGVGLLNGISPTQRNWRHGSIAGRVGYVVWLSDMGFTREHVDRTVRRIKLGLWVLLALAIMATLAQTLLPRTITG